MAYSTTTDLVLNNICILPETGITLSEKLTDCYRQLDENTQNNGFALCSIIKQTIFLSASNNSDYYQSKQKLLVCAKDFFDELPPTSIVSQSPDNGSLVLEVVYLNGISSSELSRKHNEENSWLIFQRGGLKMMVVSGISESDETNNILLQSNSAFEKLQKILEEEKMEFSDIVRQWNYIEKITQNVNHTTKSSQHYQIFNDVRSKYYQKADFRNGYPAATGIGTDCGGISIDVIAVQVENGGSIIAIKSPVQLDAYTYSKEVLADNSSMSDFCKTTPKFERAKIIIIPENKWLFISGTAAIIGQDSTIQSVIAHQTEVTIKNILSLISTENLQKHGINAREKASINYLRVYVKYKDDIQQVIEICQKYFPDLPVAYIVADICRPELLVEIEGQAIIY